MHLGIKRSDRTVEAAALHRQPPEAGIEHARLARLINAYNDVVKASPRRDPGPLGFFKFFFLDRRTIQGETFTLWGLERHIRAFGDPRIHFAINCGARSCPPLRRYNAARLDEQLDLATRAYLADPAGARLDRASRTLYLSRLFLWYKADFGPPPDFALRYLPADDSRAVASTEGLRIRYLPWSWDAP